MEKRVYKRIAPGVLYVKQSPRDWILFYKFDKYDNILLVDAYTRKWVDEGIVCSCFTPNYKVSTFVALCKLYKWAIGAGKMMQSDSNWIQYSIGFENDYSNESWGEFCQKMVGEICV